MDAIKGTTSTLYLVQLPRPGAAHVDKLPAVVVAGEAFEFAAAPSVVRVDEVEWLYFIGKRSGGHQVSLYRVPWPVQNIDQAELIDVPDRLSIRSWPRVREISGSRVALSYRDPESVPKVAYSIDGLRFGEPTAVSSPSAMPVVGEFGDGSLAFGFQKGRGSTMASYLRVLQQEALGWGPTTPIYPASENVHDASFLQRRDGLLDAYFITPNSAESGFAIHRRCVDPRGRLGEPELVLESASHSYAKPYAFRYGDVIWLAVSDLTSASQPAVLELDSEAQCNL